MLVGTYCPPDLAKLPQDSQELVEIAAQGRVEAHLHDEILKLKEQP